MPGKARCDECKQVYTKNFPLVRERGDQAGGKAPPHRTLKKLSFKTFQEVQKEKVLL